MMDLWVSRAMNEVHIVLTGEVLCQKWTAFVNLVGIPENEQLNLSEGWLNAFKKCHNLRKIKYHGEAGSADSAAVERERKCIQELIVKWGYRLKDVFNMDETGLFYG